MKPETFLASHPLFTREEFAESLRARGRAEATVASHLARWRRQGRISAVKRGVFVRTGDAERGQGAAPDYVALASRMAADAAVAYHTALEVHGFAQSLFEQLTFITWTRTKATLYEGRRFVPVRPRAPLRDVDRGEGWLEKADRAGTEIRVTSIERTLVDVLDRLDLAGGVHEVWRSLLSVPAFDPVPLEEYLSVLGSKTLTAKVGFFLEARARDLVVPADLLTRLETRTPRAPVFMDRGLGGRLVPRWSLIVPVDLVSQENEVDA